MEPNRRQNDVAILSAVNGLREEFADVKAEVTKVLIPTVQNHSRCLYGNNGDAGIKTKVHDHDGEIKAIKSKIEKTDKRKEWIFRATLGAAIALIVKDILQGVL